VLDEAEKGGVNRFAKIQAFKMKVYDFCLYGTFCLLFTIVMLANYNSHSYMLGEAMRTSLLVNRGGVDILDFESIKDLDSFWNWLQGTFLEGAYTDPDVTGEHKGGDGWQGPGYMYGNNHIIGAIRIRQLRVERSTDVTGIFGSNVQWKYPGWSETTQATAAYGPSGIYTYASTTEGIMDHFSGRYDYPGDGYSVLLDSKLNRTQATLDHSYLKTTNPQPQP